MTQDAKESTMPHVDEGTLHAYLDGELSPPERAAVEAHVAQCPPCRTRLAEERALLDRATSLLGLARPPERAAPPLSQLQPAKRRFWEVRAPLAWAASIALALGVGYYARDFGTPAGAPVAGFVATEQRPSAPAAKPQLRAPAPPRREVKPSAPAADEIARTSSGGARAELLDSAIAPHVPSGRRDALITPAPGVVAPVTEGPFVSRDLAREMLGTEPVGVPGLAVRRIRRNPADESGIIVEQELDSATVIELFQHRALGEPRAYLRDAPRASGLGRADSRRGAQAGSERLAKYVGPLRVEIAAPLSPDSLNRLLEQVKPLP